MSEAVTLPSLMMMTLIVSEELLARDRHTDRQTDRQTDRHTHTHTLGVVLHFKIPKVAYNFENKTCVLATLHKQVMNC